MTSTSRRDLIRQVRDANHAIYRRIWHDTVADWIRLDLTMAQVKLLFVLRHVSDDDSQVMTISSVAQRLEIGLPAASHLVDRLVQQGLASRIEDKSDRRRALLELTEAGRELANRLGEGTRDRFARWVERLDDDDLATLARGLSALAVAADESEGLADPGYPASRRDAGLDCQPTAPAV